jgi:hypothetical protein
MKPKAILGDQTFDHQLTHLRKMGCVTGFELHLTLRLVKKIYGYSRRIAKEGARDMWGKWLCCAGELLLRPQVFQALISIR